MTGTTAAGSPGTPLGGFALSAVVIGGSTGGPQVVERILRALPADFPAPVALCQHMPPDWTEMWARRLDPLCALRIKEAEDREPFRRGTVYLAPFGRHLRFRRDGRDITLRLDADFADSLFVPSIDYLMSSAAETFGSGTLAVLLTGLGSDGALGMLSVRRAGGYTIVERPESATASSMPGSAEQIGAVVESADADELARIIIERVNGVLRGT